MLRLLFGGVVDCRVRVRVRVVVLLCGGGQRKVGWSREVWAGRTGMTEGVSGRSTREVRFDGGPRQGIREGIRLETGGRATVPSPEGVRRRGGAMSSREGRG
eukprot:scaffold5892_cov56-Phaeocystis_antarctica.AAC.1